LWFAPPAGQTYFKAEDTQISNRGWSASPRRCHRRDYCDQDHEPASRIALQVRAPRVNGKRLDEATGERTRFGELTVDAGGSTLLPRSTRRASGQAPVP
jgi:hypothetical protein